MTQLLIELGTEDLPARYVLPLANALAEAVGAGLDKRGIGHGDVSPYATPRRIAVVVDNISSAQPDQIVERRGPPAATAFRDGAPTPAALGFAKTCGVAVERLAQKDGYLFFRIIKAGRVTRELVPEIFEEALKRMDELVPKRMRWGSGEETFVRPVQWLLAMLGSDVIPLSRFGLVSSDLTYGHRFHAPEAIRLTRTEDYSNELRRAKVVVDFSQRRAEIRRQVETQAAALGGTARITEDLLDEVTALVEWPVVIYGRMEDRFMVLPKEVIISTIETNQRYFSVLDVHGRLLPYFITISNIESRDLTQVVAGNERVVRPRLSDALFFWQQDLKLPLSGYAGKLAGMTFMKGLGTLADKAARVRKLAAHIATATGGESAHAERAAELCKCDLTTRMVYEFPELQGIMGGYYARAAGEPEPVAVAISEHYQPVGAGAAIPVSAAGRAVALADKLDSLVGIFATGQRPTAAKDPLGARRAALGMLRILIEGGLSMDLVELLDAATRELAGQSLLDGWVKASSRARRAADDAEESRRHLIQEVQEFLLDRLTGYFQEGGAGADVIDAVRSLSLTQPLDMQRRVAAVKAFRSLPEAESLAAANKRIRNILKQAELSSNAAFKVALCKEPSEGALAAALERCAAEAEPLFQNHEYEAGLKVLAGLRQPVDDFFNNVMVMCEDAKLKANRIALLRQLSELFLRVADISRLQSAGG